MFLFLTWEFFKNKEEVSTAVIFLKLLFNKSKEKSPLPQPISKIFLG